MAENEMLEIFIHLPDFLLFPFGFMH